MHAMWLAAIAAATMGVDVGWQPAADGGLEYIIQLEPHQAQSLKSGDVIEVDARGYFTLRGRRASGIARRPTLPHRCRRYHIAATNQFTWFYSEKRGNCDGSGNG